MERCINGVMAEYLQFVALAMSQTFCNLDTHDAWQQSQLRRLRSDIQLGLDQADRGELSPLNIEAIKFDGRRALSERAGK